jgi:hypothetical protein
MSQESESVLETLKLEVQRILNSQPQKVVVIKDDLQLPEGFNGINDDDLIEKARNVNKNLRNALNEAEMLKTDANDDREFDMI